MKLKKPMVSGLTCAMLMSFGSLSIADNVEHKSPANLVSGQAIRTDQSAPLPELINIVKSRSSTNNQLKAPTYVYPNFLDNPDKLDNADRTKTNTDRKYLQNFRGTNDAPPVDLSFDGIGQSDAPGGGLPPDTNGDVGIEYYVQYINTDWAIFDKATGVRQGNVMEGNTFWAGFGGPCETNNAGDPIVLFDKTANVWVFSQFISSANANGSQCFAVSDRQDLLDPELTFYRYQFEFSGAFNDYPHIGIWTDDSGDSSGYYFVTHDFQIPLNPVVFLGASFSVVERDSMLVGDPAQFVRFQNVGGFGGSAFGALPAHLESSEIPQVKTCAPFVHNRADLDAYLMWQLCVNWDDANSSTLTDAIRLDANAPFSSGVNPIPQPAPATAGAALDSLSGRTMYRASARAYPASTGLPLQMVINHTIDSGDGDAGIRWVDFEMSFGGMDAPAETIFANGFDESISDLFTARILDEGVFAPDDENRWMGGISIDKSTNIGLGYSVSSLNTLPSVRYTGRTPTDAAGTMQNEQSCVVGSGVQTFVDASGRVGRWGDYSSMSVDPVDQCTFWMSVEYVATTGQANWENRVCSFAYPNCGDPSFVLRTDNSRELSVCTLDGTPTIDLDVYALDGFNSTVNMSSGGNLGGASVSFDTDMVNAYPAQVVATLNDLDQAGSTEIILNLGGNSVAPAISRNILFNVSISSSMVGAANLLLPANNSIDLGVRPDFSWDAVPDALTYTIEIATDINFNDVVESATVDSTSYTAQSPLTGSTQYFWRVTANNNCGTGPLSATFEFTTGAPGSCPAGTVANTVFTDDIEGDVSDWSTPPDPVGSGNTWAQSGVNFNSGATSFLAVDSPTTSDQYLVSPSIVLPSAAESPITLSFWNFQNIEANTGAGQDACWDGAILEISTDGGANFVQIQNSNLLTDGYNGNVTVNPANPISGLDAWCADDISPASGEQETVSIVDIDAFAGQTVQFRFRLGTDGAAGDEGWYVDDVTVQSCQTP